MSVSVLNTTAGLSGKTLALLEGSQTFTGQKTFDVGASAPFVVVSGAAKVSNLDADKLDGAEGTAYHDAAQLTGLTPAASVFVEQTSSLTGTNNDVAPSAGPFIVIRCTGAAPVFTGFTGGATGRSILLLCLGTTLKVSHQTGSSAANQIICESAAGQIVGLGGSILLTYDATTSRWRASLLNAGAPISVTFAAGDFTGNALMTWTVAAGDVEVFRYQQRGRTVRVELMVFTSTVAGTPDTTLQVAMPGGFTPSVNASGRSAFYAAYASDNGTEAIARTDFSATKILFVKVPSANWTAAVDTTRVAFNGDITVD